MDIDTLLNTSCFRKKCNDGKEKLFIVTNETRSNRYGIGTYVYQFLEAVKDFGRSLVVIVLSSQRTSVVNIEYNDNVQYIYIADARRGRLNNYEYRKYYFKSVLLLLKLIFPYLKNPVFVINYLYCSDLVDGFRKNYSSSKIFGVVHYMDWSFRLLGNTQKMKSILGTSNIDEYLLLKDNFYEGCRFFMKCDKVIIASKYTYDFLISIYPTLEKKLLLINHGIKDEIPILNYRNELRTKYGFKESDILLIYAGRLDLIKGIAILSNAFLMLSKKYENIYLLVAGEGDYSLLQERLLSVSKKVSLLGFVERYNLYELFYMSDIGIIPSLYEEFGYVALEMMMNRLPVIAGGNGGLRDIVVDGKTGYVIDFKSDDKYIDEDSSLLASYMEVLINSPLMRIKMGEKGRERYLHKYGLNIFIDKLKYELFD